MFENFTDSMIFQWIVIPLLIFTARVGDVSMDTLRIMLISRGKRLLASSLGFFQVLIWLMAFRQIVLNLSNPICYIAFAGGFATGTYVGMFIEEKLAIGFQVIRVITRQDAAQLVEFLRRRKYGVTSVDGLGTMGKVNIIYTIIKRSEIPHVIRIIKRFNPKAFFTVEDIRSISDNGYTPLRKS